MNIKTDLVQKIGGGLVDMFHYLALFVIGATIVWSAVYEYLRIIQSGHAALDDILLLFIYLELGAIVGVYFKTHRLPVQILIYVAITALSRHLVIDTRGVSDDFHLYLLLSTTGAIMMLSFSVLILTSSASKYGLQKDDA
ncbi:MAG: phosphate-starvation-inducible protein PsiE [Burkholderiales bacterium]